MRMFTEITNMMDAEISMAVKSPEFANKCLRPFVVYSSPHGLFIVVGVPATITI